MSSYPKFITRPGDSANLRQVASRMFVGGEDSPPMGDWSLVVDLCGQHRKAPGKYARARNVISMPFTDGDPIPDGFLDDLLPRVIRAIGDGNVLFQCRAGMSRSASVAYAMLRRIFGKTHEQALSRVQVPHYESFWPMPVTLGSARSWVFQRRNAPGVTVPAAYLLH